MSRGRPEKLYEATPDGNAYVGSLVKFIRIQRGFSREAFAEGLYRNPEGIRHIETNLVKPSGNVLKAMAEILGTDLTVFTDAPAHPRITSPKAKLKRAEVIDEPSTIGQQIDTLIATHQLSTPDERRLRQALISVTLAFCKVDQ